MAARKRSTDHVIVNAGRGGRFECLRCGRFHEIRFPIEMGAYAALDKWFGKEHRGCRLKPEGLHCRFCGNTGHEPMACEKLRPKSPQEWLDGPDTGASSGTIFRVMTGRSYLIERFGPGSAPRDPDDFGRCHRLLKAFPAWRERLGEVATLYRSEWGALVEHWAELEALYAEELPTGMAPKLYARMQELRARRSA